MDSFALHCPEANQRLLAYAYPLIDRKRERKMEDGTSFSKNNVTRKP